MPGYDMQYNLHATIACTGFHTLHNIVIIHAPRWEEAMTDLLLKSS